MHFPHPFSVNISLNAYLKLKSCRRFHHKVKDRLPTVHHSIGITSFYNMLIKCLLMLLICRAIQNFALFDWWCEHNSILPQMNLTFPPLHYISHIAFIWSIWFYLFENIFCYWRCRKMIRNHRKYYPNIIFYGILQVIFGNLQ